MSLLYRSCAAVARRSSYSTPRIATVSDSTYIRILGSNTSTSTRPTTNTNTSSSNRSYSSSSPQLQKSSPFYDFVNRYSVSGQQHRIAVANHLFRAAQFQAFRPHWYTKTNTNINQDDIDADNSDKGESKTAIQNTTGTGTVRRLRLGLSSSLRQHHAMLTLHIWFLHRRLLAETQLPNNNESNDEHKHDKNSTSTAATTTKGKGSFQLMIQEELFDTFWNDTQARIRAAGVHELSVNKFLKELQQQSMLQMTQYDHACAEFEKGGKDGKGGGIDRSKRFEIICDGVWRHLLGGGVVSGGSGSGSSDDSGSSEDTRSDDSDDSKDDSKKASVGEVKGDDDDIPDELIRRMGAYVEYQLDNIVFRLPDDYFDRGMVAWGSMPDLDVDVDVDLDASTETDANSSDADAELDVDADASKEDKADEKDAMSGMDFINDEWVRVLNDAGEPYYWNMESDEVTWTEPEPMTMINNSQ